MLYLLPWAPDPHEGPKWCSVYRMTAESRDPGSPIPGLKKLGPERWNITSLMGKELRLVHKLKKFRLDTLGPPEHIASAPEPAFSKRA